jgi:ligand-binding SRPBCC domain-containing protein
VSAPSSIELSVDARWRHEHVFAVLGERRTRMTDRLTYRLP